jgi:uncharacterized membrane protein
MDGSSGCNISETINCDIVNKGPLSEMFGIPVALYGVLFYLLLAIVAYHIAFSQEKNNFIVKSLPYLSGFGLIYSLSLGSYVFYRLEAICPVCVASYIVIAIIFALSFKASKNG